MTGTMRTRAASVGTARFCGSSCPMRSFLAQRPNLPPQQSSDNQVKIGGQIRLACASGCRMGAQHEQATPGKRGEPPAHQFPEPSLYPVANHRRANRTANNKAYLRHRQYLSGYRQRRQGRLAAADDQRARSRPPGGPSAARAGTLPARLIRDCCGSTTPPAQRGPPATAASATSAASLVRRAAARGPYDGARQARHGQHGYASAAGSRGPSPADGCSAGTYACSLELHKYNS